MRQTNVLWQICCRSSAGVWSMVPNCPDRLLRRFIGGKINFCSCSKVTGQPASCQPCWLVTSTVLWYEKWFDLGWTFIDQIRRNTRALIVYSCIANLWGNLNTLKMVAKLKVFLLLHACVSLSLSCRFAQCFPPLSFACHEFRRRHKGYTSFLSLIRLTSCDTLQAFPSFVDVGC